MQRWGSRTGNGDGWDLGQVPSDPSPGAPAWVRTSLLARTPGFSSQLWEAGAGVSVLGQGSGPWVLWLEARAGPGQWVHSLLVPLPTMYPACVASILGWALGASAGIPALQ